MKKNLRREKGNRFFYSCSIVEPDEGIEPVYHVEGRTDDKDFLDKVVSFFSKETE
ncbi:MAG: hypothetical protein V5A64_07170 [Candidatus Thermoplasmatota archaeon]